MKISEAYPYDSDRLKAGNGKEVLDLTYKLTHELMYLYEPFGQAGSTYCDTGYPEMTAIGLRRFLSVSENLAMLRDIGEKTLDSLVLMGYVTKHCSSNVPEQDKKTQENWERIIDEIQQSDERTYRAIMDGIKCEEEKDSDE